MWGRARSLLCGGVYRVIHSPQPCGKSLNIIHNQYEISIVEKQTKKESKTMKKLIIPIVIISAIAAVMMMPVVFYESGKWRFFSDGDDGDDRVIAVGRFYNVVLRLFKRENHE